jgi:hypothetical protein
MDGVGKERGETGKKGGGGGEAGVCIYLLMENKPVSSATEKEVKMIIIHYRTNKFIGIGLTHRVHILQ